MSFTSAKTNFEAVVKSMQADLERYVAGGKANQRAVDIRTEHINKLVEFYQQVDDLVTALEGDKNELSLKYGALHADTTKLVLFAKLHCINPNLVFHYGVGELKTMLATGVRMIPPQGELLNVKVVMLNDIGGFEKPEIELTDSEINSAATQKYQHLNRICK
jgi:hypothetical protein